MICNSLNSHASIFSNNGSIKPCCAIDIDESFDFWSDSSIDKLKTINDSLNLPVREILKQDLKNGWIPECKYCEKLERANLKSPRIYSNEKLSGQGLEELQLALDFYCNMNCRICRPGTSSKWDSLTNIVFELKKLEYHHYNDIGDNKSHVEYLKKIIDKTDFSNLKFLRMVGGEPFYSPNLYWFLDLLKTKTDISNITFYCNTNGSIIPSKKILKILHEFKSVKIDISIDAVEHLAESIRPGVEWNTILKNVAILNNEFNIMLSPTVSILNVNALQPIINLGYDYYFMPLETPYFLKHTQISIEKRTQWLTNDEEVNKLILLPYEKINKNIFTRSMKLMDSKMPSFSKSNKEIWTLMN